MKIGLIPKAIAGLIAATVILAAPQAKASLDFTLVDASVPLTGPFGTVSLNLVDSTHATVTLTALGPYSFGAQTTLGLNLASAATASDLSLVGRSGGGTPSLASYVYVDQNVNGEGKFNFAVNLVGGFGNSATSLMLTLTKTSGTWASVADILQLNSKGHAVVGHVMDPTDPPPGVERITGYASAPEPTTLLAGALLLLPFGLSTVRFLRKTPAA